MNKEIIIFLYNRLFDPVIQSNFWLYINGILNDPSNQIKLSLISYEDPDNQLTEEQASLVEKWQSQGLVWHKLNWHAGLSPIAKFIDLVNGFFALLKLRLQGKSRIISVATIAGSFVYLYSFLLPLRRYLYCYEPHSEYSRDSGIWTNSSFQFRFLNYLEKLSVKNCQVVSSGTKFMKKRVIEEWGFSKPDFYTIPTVVDDNKFMFNAEDRQSVRLQLEIGEDVSVLFYPGKFGYLYYEHEIPRMFKTLQKHISNIHFLIVTPTEHETVQALFEAQNIDPRSYTITTSTYEGIPRYFSAADFGIIAVPPGPSKRFVSNIKVGEYLCSGLPFLITKGVSEDYLYATDKSVGVVVDSFEVEEFDKKAKEIKKYLDLPVNERRAHCRQIGVEYRGYSVLRKTFALALNDLCQ